MARPIGTPGHGPLEFRSPPATGRPVHPAARPSPGKPSMSGRPHRLSGHADVRIFGGGLGSRGALAHAAGLGACSRGVERWGAGRPCRPACGAGQDKWPFWRNVSTWRPSRYRRWWSRTGLWPMPRMNCVHRWPASAWGWSCWTAPTLQAERRQAQRDEIVVVVDATSPSWIS